jgi:hypothetical protein
MHQREMRYVTPSVFNYSFAVNNYRALYYVIFYKKYRQMQFVDAGSLQDVFLMNVESGERKKKQQCGGEKISSKVMKTLDIHVTMFEGNS